MGDKQDHLPRFFGSNLSLAVDEAEPNVDGGVPLSSSRSQDTCATLVVDDVVSSARSSMDLPANISVETLNQSSIMKEKYLEALQRPESPPNPITMHCKTAIHREPPRHNASQLSSYHYQDEALNLISPKKQSLGSRKVIERNRLYFPPGVNPSNSPAEGRSSSVDGIKKASFVDEDSVDSDSFIDFARISNKPNTCRRSLSSLSLPPLNSNGKSLPESISLTNPTVEWVERRNENSKVTFFPTSTYLSSFFRILSPFSTSHPSPELTSPSLHIGARFPPESNLWKMIIVIPRLAISLIQYIISPWIGWLSLPEFVLRKKSFGDTMGPSKFRRKKFMTCISIIYGLFCLFMFSSWFLPKIGLLHGNFMGPQDLKVIDGKINYSMWDRFISFIHSPENQIDSNLDEDGNDQWDRQKALKRKVNSLLKTQPPLNSIPHTARFSKLHSKSGKHDLEEMTPILFQGTLIPEANSITACLYSNQFWLDSITLFLNNWNGPVSLVVECLSGDRADVIDRMESLRETHSLIKQRVDFHLVTVPDGTPIQRLRNAERMLVNPTATNAQLNLARFFSRSDMVWLLGDARVYPSAGLYTLLTNHIDLRSRVLDYGDAIIIPNFAFNRERDVYPHSSWSKEGSDLSQLAQQYIDETLSSLPLSTLEWPETLRDVLSLTKEPSERDSNSTVLTMYDSDWEPNKGPSNWTMWQKFASTNVNSNVILKDDGTDATTKKLEGMADQLYPIVRYDLKYAPNVIVSKETQPWCTERFEYNKAACVYQMYLTGTELWVIPEAWSLTVEQIPQNTKKYSDDDALKDLISSRLYSKFHQEACMHYGREFSSLGAWEDDRSKHAKAICMHVLSSWGISTSSSNIVL